MPRYHLAQLNIATLLAPLESPQLADFVADLDRINALADAAPGFVWRWIEADETAHPAHPFGEGVIVNLSLWTDVAALQAFAFRSGHTEVLRRRREWFAPMREAYAVLWWVPEGHRPSPLEAAERLQCLRESGPGADAFGFREAFPPPG